VSSSDNGWLEWDKLDGWAYTAYRNRYISSQHSSIRLVKENYILHYKAAHRPNPPHLSVERMEFTVNETIKQRMLRS